ncbi:glycosyltransferase [Thermochromatium tepidum]|uniref:Glycosyltransferase n=1 Tax=Thermochromatium tepidum ATCC 43061 TaxID=316276 RepID=A0A6I6E3F4_THETI|nr:glycosyltransferase [Thermochromatium tepidum]QGU33475.1 glycosyltransferase [Thermochromatium tepidum ATCC 43061]
MTPADQEPFNPPPRPLVSILIRTLGRATLAETLDSVAAQTYPRIEVVLIDVRGRRELDPPPCAGHLVRLVSSGRRLGRGAAANLGLDSAQGDFLLFLDDDDWLLPEHVAGLVEAIESRTDARAAYAGIECRRQTAGGEWEVVHVFNQPYDPLRLLFENYLPIHAVLFARSLVGDMLRFDESLEVYEDWDFWLQLSALTPLIHVDRVTGVYRIQGASGFGLQQDDERLRHGLAAFFDKWRSRWTLDQLLGLVEYAKHRPMYLELRERCAAETRGLIEQTHALRLEREDWKIRHALLASEKEALEARLQALHQQLLSARSSQDADRELLDLLGIRSLRDALQCRADLERYRSWLGWILGLTDWLTWPVRAASRQVQRLLAPLADPASRLGSHAEHLVEILRFHGAGPVARALVAKLGRADGRGTAGLATLWQVARIAALGLRPEPQPQVALLVDLERVCIHTLWLLEELIQSRSTPPFEPLFLHPSGHLIGELLERRVPEARHLALEPGASVADRFDAVLAATKADWILMLDCLEARPRDWLWCLLHGVPEGDPEVPRVGAVSPKLVGSDGRLIEAGRRRALDGTVWPIGAGADPQAPEYSYPRTIDSASEVGLLLSRSALESVLGTARPTEISELLDALRSQGWTLLYQPEVTLVCLERSAAAGAEQGRLLVIDAVMLTPDQDSGSLRMLNLLETFLALGWHVAFAPSNLESVEPYGSRLQRLGVEVLTAPRIESIHSHLQARGAGYDLVILSRASIADQFFEVVRRYAPQAEVWFDTVDLHFLREQREAELKNDPAALKRAAQRRRQELDLIARADLTLVVSPVERDLLARELPGARLEVLSNIHDLHPTHTPFEERDAILFIGGFNHDPNVDAVLYYVEEILPRVESELGPVPTFILGSRPPPGIRALEDPRRGLHVTGYVEDPRPYFERARLSIAPLRYGAGVKGKINLSLAYGVPVVATPCAAEGMYLTDGVDVLIGADAEAFAAAVARLYRDSSLWQRLVQAGFDNIERHFSRRVARATLERLLAGHAA